MGLLSWLSGRHYSEVEEQAEFRQFTNDKRWDILLELVYTKIEKQKNEWHNMGPEQRDMAAIRQCLLYELLNDIELSGGRVEMNAVVPFEAEEIVSEITPHRHLGVPHFRTIEQIEAEKAEQAEKERENAS